MNLPFVIVDGVPVLAGMEDGQLVGIAVPGGQLASFETDEVTGFVSIDPAAVYFGGELRMVREQGMPIAAAPKKQAGRFKPRGHLFQPLPEGMVSGYPLARPALERFRAEIPSEDVVRLSALFAISTIRVRIEAAEASFECFAEFYEKARGQGGFPAIDDIRSCFGQLKNTKARQFSEVSEYAPTIRKAMQEGMRDRALRRYLAMETVLPEGLGLAKLSFTLLLLGQDCMCLDTRILSRMFGSWSKGEQIQTGWPKTDKGHISELGLRRYESVEESFLAGNRFYDPKDPIGRGRAQWLSWEPLGHPPAPATHSVWLKVVTKPQLAVVRSSPLKRESETNTAELDDGTVIATSRDLLGLRGPAVAYARTHGQRVTVFAWRWNLNGYEPVWRTGRDGELRDMRGKPVSVGRGLDPNGGPIARENEEAGRREGAYRGWEHRRERDEFVQQNLPPELLPLWSRIGSSFHGSPEQRYTDFMQYVHDHPDESMSASQSESSAKVQQLIRQRMTGAPARRFAIDDRVLVRPKHSRGFPLGPGVVYDIANGKYEIRWENGESGWFASTDLHPVSTDAATPIAHAIEETLHYKGVPFDLVTVGSQGSRWMVRIGEGRELGPFSGRGEAEQAAHDYIDQRVEGPDSSQRSETDPHDLPARPKPPNPVALDQLAAAFLSDIENPGNTYWKDYMGDARVPKIVAALRSLKIQDGIGPVLGHGAFGTATALPDGRILKLTSDPSEVQAGYVLTGKKLKHVVEIYGAWFVRGVRVKATVAIDPNGRPKKTHPWPMGISIVERVTPLDRDSTGFEGLTNTVINYKQEHHLFPAYFTKIGPARTRTLLKDGSEGLEAVLRDNGKWLRTHDMVNDAYLAEGVADALKETREYGVYAVDVHGGNVGYVEDANGDRTYKIYDIGSSSAPAAPHAPTVPAPPGGKKTVSPEQLSFFPGMVAEPQPVPWVGEGVDELEPSARLRRRA